MGQTLYCRPSDIVTANATLSWTVSSANANYPVTNAKDLNPAKPAKAVAVTATLRATFGGAQTLEMMLAGPHNFAGAAGVTLSNGAGLSRAQTVSANRNNGLSVNLFDDFSTAANRSSTTWDLAINTALANVALGEWSLITTRRTMKIQFDPEFGLKHKTIIHRTEHDVKLKYWMGTAQRRIQGTWRMVEQNSKTEISDFLALVEDAQGPYKSFVLCPDSASSEAFLVDLETDEQTIKKQLSTFGTADVTFVEVQRGPAL
jgi:hypothetical protein